MNRRSLLALAAGALFIATQAPLPAHADALATIEANKVIRIAVPQDFAPFGSVGADMQPKGYDVDVANLFGKYLGVPVEITPYTTAARIPAKMDSSVSPVPIARSRAPTTEASATIRTGVKSR